MLKKFNFNKWIVRSKLNVEIDNQDINKHEKNNYYLYSPENEVKMENKNKCSPEDNNKFEIPVTKFENFNEESKDNCVDKFEILFSNKYIRDVLNLKILQRTYDHESIEWLFNV